MTRFLYDSTNIQDDPAGAAMVAYYCDGAYAVSEAAVRARFPSAVLVPISAIGTNSGIVGDVEPGCMTIAQSVNWVRMRRAAGVDPTIYCNELYGWAPVRRAFQAARVPEPHYFVADYDGIAVVPPSAVAKQFANSTLTGGHFDKSVALDVWPGVDNSPQIGQRLPGGALITHSSEDSDMALLAHPTLPRWDVFVVGQDGKVYHGWGTTDALAAYKDSPTWENWDAPGSAAGGVAAPGTLSAAWGPNHLVVMVAHPDGNLFEREVDGDFTQMADWRPVMIKVGQQAKVMVPVGAKGPAGLQGIQGPAGTTPTTGVIKGPIPVEFG